MNHRVCGTRVKYVIDKCRCERCRAANAAAYWAYKKHKAKLAFGAATPFYVDAEPARRHVRGLMAAGIGWQRIARLSGVPTGAVSKLLYGDGPRGMAPSKRIRPETECKLLAVTSALLADGARVDGTGVRRRLRALVAIGWSQSELARRLGMGGPTNFTPLISGGRKVLVSTARAVGELYEQLWATPPKADDHRSRISASRAKRLAATRGWVPPLAWDDDTIDDPDASPDLGEPDGRRALDLGEVAHLRAGGCSDEEIARRLGVAVTTIKWAVCPSRAAAS